MDQLSRLDTGICVGTLVLHVDGSQAACTLEFEGLGCGGLEAEHVGGSVTCEDLLGVGGCEQCSMSPADDMEDEGWRHAVHVGRMASARRRCRVHLVVLASPKSVPAMVVDRADALCRRV